MAKIKTRKGEEIIVEVVGEQNARNLENAKELNLASTAKVRGLAQLNEMGFDFGVLTFLGPTPTGKTIVRFIARQIDDVKMLKGHFELSVSPKEAVRLAMKEAAFYKGLWSTKLSQFIGYKAEKILMDAASELHTRAYLKTGGRKVAEHFDKRFVEGNVFAIQTSNGHGIDLFGEFVPPPPGMWGTIDSKGTMKAEFGNYATPKGPGLSEKQLDGEKNLLEHINKAMRSHESGENIYKISEKQAETFERFLGDYKRNKKCLQAYVATLGLKDGFQLASNDKYKKGMIIIERLEEAAARDARALARAARRAKKNAEDVAKKAKEEADEALKDVGNTRGTEEDITEAVDKYRQKQKEYERAQRQVEEVTKDVERLENKAKNAMERLSDKV